MISWLFLTIGLMLGMLWAYEELGWGGTGSGSRRERRRLALVHRHGVSPLGDGAGTARMLRVWNMSLVIATFFLTIFGTFLTRSAWCSRSCVRRGSEAGVDVHAFMVAMLVFSFGFVIYRLPLLQVAERVRLVDVARGGVPGQQLDPAVQRVLRPVRDDVPDAERSGARRTHYRRRAVLQPLDAADRPGAAAADRHRSAARVAQVDVHQPPRSVPLPGRARVAVGAGVVALGVRIWSAGLCFAFSGFVIGTILQEFWRGARVRQGTTGTDLFTALVGLVGRNKRRYGGYVVHVGVVLIFLGFAGSNGFKQEETGELRPGQNMTSVTTRCASTR